MSNINRIVKVQRPIYPVYTDPFWLVYDQAGEFEDQIHDKDVPNLVKSSMGTKFKAFFDAHWDPSEEIWLFTGPMVKDRNW